MEPIQNYNLYLFDLDGLLVNTEEIHFLAYKKMCANRGATLDWDFNRYCQAAHYDSEGLRLQIYDACPKLFQQEQDWQVLYREKQTIIKDLLRSDEVALMPGAEELLTMLKDKNLNRAVVTHSPDELISIIRDKLPLLNTIPHWITRHQYTKPKPNPECYLKAIELLAKPGDKVIGFEDSPRGMTALLGSSAKPILVCQAEYPEIKGFLEMGVERFRSLKEVLNII